MKVREEVRLCPALKRAKITDPETQAGKDFCTQKCPYSECIAMEGDTFTKIAMAKKKAGIRRLFKKGMMIEDIAVRIGKATKTVRKYLR